MITVCTVILDGIDNFYEIYKESITTRTSLVDEVLIAKVDDPIGVEKKWTVGNIQFNQFGIMQETRTQQGVEHALGLHTCIDRAKNDILLFCDPDVFFYRAVDEFYYNLMNKYNLNIIGVSHSAALRFAYTFYPYLSSLMVRKKDLPDENWLKGQIIEESGVKRDGKYLIRMKIPGLTDCFPDPSGDFDTGSYLWLWGHQQNWRWVSFQTRDAHTYVPMYNRNNVKITERLDKKKLLYHATSSTVGQTETWELFKQAWLESKETEE